MLLSEGMPALQIKIYRVKQLDLQSLAYIDNLFFFFIISGLNKASCMQDPALPKIYWDF